jgi:hypothetical protein
MFTGFLGPAKLQALMVLDQEPIQVLMEIVPRHGGASSRGSIHPSRGPLGVAALLSVQMPKLSVRYPTRNKARGGCFARAPVEMALRFDLGRADRDGLLDAAIYFSAVHGSFNAQLGNCGDTQFGKSGISGIAPAER